MKVYDVEINWVRVHAENRDDALQQFMKALGIQTNDPTFGGRAIVTLMYKTPPKPLAVGDVVRYFTHETTILAIDGEDCTVQIHKDPECPDPIELYLEQLTPCYIVTEPGGGGVWRLPNGEWSDSLDEHEPILRGCVS